MDKRSKAERLAATIKESKDGSKSRSRKRVASEKNVKDSKNSETIEVSESTETSEFFKRPELEKTAAPSKSPDESIPNTASTTPKAKPSSGPMRQSRLSFGGVKPEPAEKDGSAGRPASPPSNKRKRAATKPAHPSVEKYAHLAEVADTIAPGLILVLVGNNPGVTTAEKGHPYSHPTNLFWRLLHWSGCTPRLLAPQEHRSLPTLFSLGQTNIVSRPTKDASELTQDEYIAGAGVLEQKFAHSRPEAVCLVGKGIWESVWRYKYGKKLPKNEFKWGWQDERHNMGRVKGQFAGSRVFVATSTSGLAASLSTEQKLEIWKPLGEFVERRRMEREQEDNPENQSS